MKSLVAVAALLISSASFALPRHVSIPLGETRSVTIPERIATIEVSNPDVLHVRTKSDGRLTLEPQTTGKTRVYLTTESNAEVELVVFVTSGGDVEVLMPR